VTTYAFRLTIFQKIEAALRALFLLFSEATALLPGLRADAPFCSVRRGHYLGDTESDRQPAALDVVIHSRLTAGSLKC
jgi:hypothetical protein